MKLSAAFEKLWADTQDIARFLARVNLARHVCSAAVYYSMIADDGTSLCKTFLNYTSI
jgi:hypothetical protein